MSRVQFFLFVEGGLDRPFGNRLLTSLFLTRTWSHQVIGMKELPSQTGGKPALITLFKSLRRAGKLYQVAFGKPMVCAFLADKDIDDLTNIRVKSPNFLYTDTYDLEGHLFQCGNLVQAIADACLVTPVQASNLLGSQQLGWINEHVQNWKEWTALCIISHRSKVNVGSGYSRPSAVNTGHIGPTDAVALSALSDALKLKLGLTDAEFNKKFARAEALVQASVSAKVPLRFFKGKWLQLILEKYLQSRPRIPDANLIGAGERVVSALVAQAGNHGHCMCCQGFADGVRNLALPLP